MIVPPYFIDDEEVFIRFHVELESVVRSAVRLPMVPFQSSFKVCGFKEFDWTMSDEFWPVLQGLASQSGDRELVFAVLDPDPVNYYKFEFGYYNWAILPATLSSDDYWSFLNSAPAESPADSILYNTEVVVFTVPSKRWVVWGERKCELCVLASSDGDKLAVWNDLDWVVNLFPYKDPFKPWRAFATEVAKQFGSPATRDSPSSV